MRNKHAYDLFICPEQYKKMEAVIPYSWPNVSISVPMRPFK